MNPDQTQTTTVATSDTSPWWIKELRIYGMAGIAAAGLAWGLVKLYGDSREDVRAKDAVIQVQTAKVEVLVEKNTDAFNGVKNALQDHSRSIDRLNERLDKTTPR